jgi:hypothetical protein
MQVRAAARQLVSAAPFAVALKMLCAQARLLCFTDFFSFSF